MNTRTPGITTMLDLSTHHVPSDEPDFGDERVLEHEYGWVMFLRGGLEESELAETVPEWLQPVYRAALQADCILVNFDRDAPLHEQFPHWEW